jgi:hypothetical protein
MSRALCLVLRSCLLCFRQTIAALDVGGIFSLEHQRSKPL